MIKLEARSFVRPRAATRFQLPLWLLLAATPFATLAIVAAYHHWRNYRQEALAIDAVQGTWRLTSENDRYLKVLNIDGNQLVAPQVLIEDLTGKIELYPLRVPRQFIIRLDRKRDAFLHGIYSVNADELMLCVTSDANDRPTTFVEDDKTTILRYVRSRVAAERR